MFKELSEDLKSIKKIQSEMKDAGTGAHCGQTDCSLVAGAGVAGCPCLDPEGTIHRDRQGSFHLSVFTTSFPPSSPQTSQGPQDCCVTSRENPVQQTGVQQELNGPLRTSCCVLGVRAPELLKTQGHCPGSWKRRLVGGQTPERQLHE